MAFAVPGWWSKGVVAGLALLAVGGALLAVADGLRDTSRLAGCDPYGAGTTPDCRSDRLTVTVVDALGRGTLGPGIAMVVLAGVYLIAAGIQARRAETGDAA